MRYAYYISCSVVAGCLFGALVACSQVVPSLEMPKAPATAEVRAPAVPEVKTGDLPPGFDRYIGDLVYDFLARGKTMCTNPALLDPINQVANRIIDAAKHSRYEHSLYEKTAKDINWKVEVFKKDDSMEPIALPNGRILIPTGLIRNAKDTDTLAVLLGHEVTHVLAGHLIGRIRKIDRVVLSTLVSAAGAGTITGVLTKENVKGVLAALGVGGAVAGVHGIKSLAFAREEETEADHFGLVLAGDGGFDPRNAVQFWENQGKSGGLRLPEFLSTHPGYDKRITNLRAWAKEETKKHKKLEAAILIPKEFLCR